MVGGATALLQEVIVDTGAALVGISAIIALFAYLETIRCDLRSEIKEVQAAETARKDIL